MAIPRQRIRVPRGSWFRALTGALRGGLWDGEDIERLERAFASKVGSEHAIAVSSGRAGLRTILTSLGLEPDAEIICPAFGYPVVPHLAQAMGYRVRFVDCELRSFGLDPEALAAAITHKTAVVIATHLYGVPCRIREIVQIAESSGAVVIEDCAHCLGASVAGQHVGTFGRVAYFSFETSKMINTLGGGIVTTDDGDLAERMREDQSSEERKSIGWLVRRLAKTSFEATVTGPLVFNAGVYPALRLAARRQGLDERFASGYQADHFTLRGRTGQFTNYQAGLGLPQIANSDSSLRRRVENAERLIGALEPRVSLQQAVDPEARSNYMLVTARFGNRPEVSASLLRMGIDTKHHYMRDCSRALNTGEQFLNAMRLEAEVLHLPAFPEMSGSQIDRVSRGVLRTLDSLDTPPAASTSNQTLANSVQHGKA